MTQTATAADWPTARSGLVHPARCIEITKINKHAHRRTVGHGVPSAIVVRHRIHYCWTPADLIVAPIEKIFDRLDPTRPKRQVLQPYLVQLAPLPLISVARHKRGDLLAGVDHGG